MDRAVHVGVASGADELAPREPRAVAGPEIGVRRWAALGLLCLGAFLVVLDTTIVNIAIPNILSSLRLSLDEVLWTLNAYTLVYAALLITGGRLGDLFGHRRVLVVGITLFVVASIACSMSQTAVELIAARVAQAMAALSSLHRRWQ
jgi:MFS family permease